MTNQKIKVVVTGGAGFIGSHLTDELMRRGFTVHVVDNLSGGKEEHLNPEAIFHKVDVRDFEQLSPIFAGAQYVFHCAAIPRVQPSIQDPRTTHDTNVNGTLNVLVAARDTGVRRVIYSASSSAYGNQKVLPAREDMEPRPMSPYALQKYTGELMCRLFSQIYDLQTVSLRYFNVYGPRASCEGAYASAIGKFFIQRSRSEPLTIVLDGTQSRDFTHVRDAVRANVLAAESPNVGAGEIINIGGGKNRTILEVAELVGGPTVFIEPRLELQHSLADITKAKELLLWEPQIKFEDGIEELRSLYKIS